MLPVKLWRAVVACKALSTCYCCHCAAGKAKAAAGGADASKAAADEKPAAAAAGTTAAGTTSSPAAANTAARATPSAASTSATSPATWQGLLSPSNIAIAALVLLISIFLLWDSGSSLASNVGFFSSHGSSSNSELDSLLHRLSGPGPDAGGLLMGGGGGSGGLSLSGLGGGGSGLESDDDLGSLLVNMGSSSKQHKKVSGAAWPAAAGAVGVALCSAHGGTLCVDVVACRTCAPCAGACSVQGCITSLHSYPSCLCFLHLSMFMLYCPAGGSVHQDAGQRWARVARRHQHAAGGLWPGPAGASGPGQVCCGHGDGGSIHGPGAWRPCSRNHGWLGVMFSWMLSGREWGAWLWGRRLRDGQSVLNICPTSVAKLCLACTIMIDALWMQGHVHTYNAVLC
jgi:hypothetical protein